MVCSKPVKANKIISYRTLDSQQQQQRDSNLWLADLHLSMRTACELRANCEFALCGTVVYQFSESQIKVPWSAIVLKIVIFIRFCIVNKQSLPVQNLIKCTKSYKNLNFQNDGASKYSDSDWELVHWPALSSGVFIFFVFGAKLYRSCHIRDKGLFHLL